MELLQTKPSCENCLAWSEDGELAVAAGEHVVLLGKLVVLLVKGLSNAH